MQFTVDGIEQEFIELSTFRQEQNLPDDFSLAMFDPKDYTDLGIIDHIGAEALNELREIMIENLPEQLTLSEYRTFLEQYQFLFRVRLHEANAQIGLRQAELDFAESGFADVNQLWMYALIRTRTTQAESPSFMNVYHQWFNDSIHLSGNHFTYTHEGQVWHIQVVHSVYGRIGLYIQTEDAEDYVYVYDPVYACPAEGFMTQLLTQVSEHLAKVLQ